MENNQNDILYRAVGGVVIFSGIINILISFLFFTFVTYILLMLFLWTWVWIALLWLTPGILALVYVIGGIVLAVNGNKTRLLGLLPIVGIVISLLNFNIIGIVLDIIALVLGIIGYSKYPQDNREIPF